MYMNIPMISILRQLILICHSTVSRVSNDNNAGVNYYYYIIIVIIIIVIIIIVANIIRLYKRRSLPNVLLSDVMPSSLHLIVMFLLQCPHVLGNQTR